MALVKFLTGSSMDFQGLDSKDQDTLYIITDERRIYKGDVPFSGVKCIERIFLKRDEVIAKPAALGEIQEKTVSLTVVQTLEIKLHLYNNRTHG